MRVGVIGLGAIGRFLVRILNNEQAVPDCTITAALDERGMDVLKGKLLGVNATIRGFDRLEEFATSGIDIVVEAASKAVAANYVPRLLSRGIPVIICSAGCLADPAVLSKVEEACRAGRTHCYVPSGAIGGLDLVQAAGVLGKLTKLTITTRKPSLGFGLNGGTAAEPQTLFEGSAYEAIEKFPNNVNSSIALSLAGLGSKRTQVRVVLDPTTKGNTHHIHIEGAFGRAEVVVENQPLPDNPKTSCLAALSVVATLRALNQPIRVGV
jgi:aspartate dehydrogenase